jgi:hypothetical protein
MTVHSKGPYWVEIAYRSNYGAHNQTIPTLEWQADGGFGLFDTHAGGTIAADDMIEEFVDAQCPFYHSHVVFESYTIFYQPDEDTPSIPVSGKVLTQIGTAVGTAWDKAVQATWTFKDTAGQLVRYVQLDMNSGNVYNRVTAAGIAAEGQAFIDLVTAMDHGYASRAGNRPAYFRQVAYTLSEKLRAQYGMI